MVFKIPKMMIPLFFRLCLINVFYVHLLTLRLIEILFINH